MTLGPIRRRCNLDDLCRPPHAWEHLNPATMESFRRGRVVFLCMPRPRAATFPQAVPAATFTTNTQPEEC